MHESKLKSPFDNLIPMVLTPKEKEQYRETARSINKAMREFRRESLRKQWKSGMAGRIVVM